MYTKEFKELAKKAGLTQAVAMDLMVLFVENNYEQFKKEMEVDYVVRKHSQQIRFMKDGVKWAEKNHVTDPFQMMGETGCTKIVAFFSTGETIAQAYRLVFDKTEPDEEIAKTKYFEYFCALMRAGRTTPNKEHTRQLNLVMKRLGTGLKFTTSDESKEIAKPILKPIK